MRTVIITVVLVFMALMSACVYCSLVVASREDENLRRASREHFEKEASTKADVKGGD